MHEDNSTNNPLKATETSSDFGSSRVLVVFISMLWFAPLIISVVLFIGSFGDHEYWGFWLALHSGPFTGLLMARDGPPLLLDFIPSIVATILFSFCAIRAYRKQSSSLTFMLYGVVIFWYLWASFGFISNFHPG